ncbi:hypothetical protein D917_05889 [Trichinella nativa]|uniref:Uncharacterized protein n=1 Tax=Trichinella nativa TaxID=6335 RepID=A0A1Y3EUT4_9BILA|nr:hypothetical protein D917_05889 [Trichinella nativa]
MPATENQQYYIPVYSAANGVECIMQNIANFCMLLIICKFQISFKTLIAFSVCTSTLCSQYECTLCCLSYSRA